jgi:hypothetical protein
VITTAEIEELYQRIGGAYFRLDLPAFAARLGKTLPDVWVEEKFRNFQALHRAISGIAPDLLGRIILDDD